MKHPPPQCLFFFLPFALILSACVSAPVAAPTPDWVTNGMEAAYPQNAYIAVEGRGNSRKAAEADALAALSRYFISNVETITQTAQVFSSETGISEHLSERNFVHSASKLFAVRYSSVWFDAHEKLYIVIAYIERDEAWRIFEPRLRREADGFRALWDIAESETAPLKSFFDYKAVQNYIKRDDWINTVNFAEVLQSEKTKAIMKDALEKQAQLSAKLNTARSMASVYIETNSDSESNITGMLTKLLSGEGLNVTNNKQRAQAFCAVTVDEGRMVREKDSGQNSIGEFYFPKIKVVISDKQNQTLFSYSAAPGKQGAVSADVAKRRAYQALAAALESNFLEELNKIQ
jgi:hypothetical protein